MEEQSCCKPGGCAGPGWACCISCPECLNSFCTFCKNTKQQPEERRERREKRGYFSWKGATGVLRLRQPCCSFQSPSSSPQLSSGCCEEPPGSPHLLHLLLWFLLPSVLCIQLPLWEVSIYSPMVSVNPRVSG